jgi:hypothetical protein
MSTPSPIGNDWEVFQAKLPNREVWPLKLDDKVLVGARMRFWSRIKKVCCSSFLKKPRQNPCFLSGDHISWSHNLGESRLSRIQVLSAYLRMHFSTCSGVWVV